MIDDLISHEEDMEVFLTSKEIVELTEKDIEIEEVLDDTPISSDHSKTAFEIYCEVKSKSSKSSAYKKRKHKSKKKKRKKKKSDYDIVPCYPLYEAYPQIIGQALYEGYRTRLGRNIPPSLTFEFRRGSAFFFGRTPEGKLVGKPLDVDGHIAVFGGSGSGKTTSIAIPNFFTWNGTIFLFDFKGDLIKWSKRRCSKILYLLRNHKNCYWYDPFYVLSKDGKENLIQNARELAFAIIPLPPDTREPFWIEAARDVLTGAIVHYFEIGETFIRAMTEIKTTSLIQLLDIIAADKMAVACVNPDLKLNPKLLSGVSMELHNHISIFATDTLIQDILSPSEDEPKEQITWTDLDGCDVFIRMDQSKIEQWRSIMRLMLVQLVRALEKRPEKYEPAGKIIPPTLLMLDEFPQYGKIDAIASSLKVLRSKNVTISLFCQSLADLDESYGKVTRSTILDNCPYKAILNSSDAETQQYFSDLVGTVKVPSRGMTVNFDELGRHTGYNANISEAREPIVYPHEFSSLSDIVLLHPGPERFCRVEKETSFRKEPNQRLIEKGDHDYV